MGRPDPVALDLLYSALASPLGLVIAVEDWDKARQKLYSARRLAADPQLAGLQFRRSPEHPTTQLWIVKGKPPE